MFVGLLYPGNKGGDSTPRSTVIAFTRADGGEIG